MNGDGFQIGIMFLLIALGMGSCSYLADAGMAKRECPTVIVHPQEKGQ